MEGVDPRDWHCFTRNLLLPADDPLRRDQQAHFDPYRCCQVVDLGPHLQLVSLQHAEAILLPICHRQSYFGDTSAVAFHVACREADRLSRQSGLVVVVQGETADLSDSDRDLRMPLRNPLYLNASIFAQGRSHRVHAHSYPIPDYLKKYFGGHVNPVDASVGPSVSFWGVCAPFAQRWSQTRCFDVLRYGLTYLDQVGLDSERIARGLGTNMKHAHRARVVRSLQTRHTIQSDLRLRPLGALVDGRYWLESDESEYRYGFYRSIYRNLYSICCRGTENYSIRFYETLCLGRIPVVVDTDIRLPFDDVIDYGKHCLILSKAQAGRASRLIAEHHARHTPRQLSLQQMANRRLWETHLSPGPFYGQLRPMLRSLRQPPQ